MLSESLIEFLDTVADEIVSFAFCGVIIFAKKMGNENKKMTRKSK